MSQRGFTITASTVLITEECCNCGVVFAMPEELRDRCLANHSRMFYCPNGHSQYYTGPTPLEKATQRATEAERKLASRNEDLRVERVNHAVTKGKLTKANNKVKRAERGVCTTCHRTFVNVQRHVENKHPELVSG
jgi:hypothetical protein